MSESVETETIPILEPGSVIDDRYRVVCLAGKGGMGVVYKAQHVHINRTVALKMLLRGSSERIEFMRFKQEAEVASQLRHPNIVAIYDFGPVGDDQFYLAMDYLDGKSLKEEIERSGPISLQRFQHIFVQACSALEHAHKNKVVHRDIKSANLVTVERDGEKDFLVVVDFGLVKKMAQADQSVTTTGTVVGSPLYMSPEQCRGLGLDHRTDIYSLGIAMYEALTGTVPFLGETMMDTILLHLKEPPPTMREANAGVYVPAALERTVLKALSKDPSMRHQTMSELAADLKQAFSGAPDSPMAFSKPSSNHSNIARQNQSALMPSGLTQQEASQVLTNQLLTSSFVLADSRKKRSVPNWVWRLVSMSIMIAVITGSVGLMVTSLNAAIMAQRKHAKIKKPVVAAAPADDAGAGSETSDANVSENPAAASPDNGDAAGGEKVAAADAQKPSDAASGEEAAKRLQQQELLEHDANNAFKADNWAAAKPSLAVCLQNREKLFDPENATLVPFLAKLTVCSYKLNDTGAAGGYITRFLKLARQHPEQIVGDPPLLSQVSEAIADVGSSADHQPTIELLKTATSNLSDRSEESVGLNLQLSRLYTKLGNVQAAEQTLRKCVGNSAGMPDLNRLSKTWLAALLTQQGRAAEAAALEN